MDDVDRDKFERKRNSEWVETVDQNGWNQLDFISLRFDQRTFGE